MDAAATRRLRWSHQGSIVAVADNAGAPIAINAYDEWGIPAASNVGRFQYTGQIWLPELGLYYYKARIYSPTLGRFMQTDPIGYEDQVNLYAYVGNDPVNAVDPERFEKLMYRSLLLLTNVAAFVFANTGFAQTTSTTMDMGGGMTHVDTMGPNGERSSSTCMKFGDGMTTCQKLDLALPRRPKSSPDTSQPRTNGNTLNFVGGLVLQAKEKSFQKKLAKMLVEGDCNGAFAAAMLSEQFDLASEIRRSCKQPALAEGANIITDEKFVAESPAKSKILEQKPISQPSIKLLGTKPITPDDSTPETDTEFEVSYLGHIFQIFGSKETSLEVLKDSFDQIFRDDPWIKYASSESGSVYFYNIKSQRNLAGRIEVWIKLDHSKDRTVKARESKRLMEVFCIDQKIRELQSTEYDATGEVISSFDDPSAASRIIPDSVGYALWEEMCS